MAATWDNVPYYYANNLAAWRAFFRQGFTRTLRIGGWGDSQETSPTGSGTVYNPAINAEFGRIFKNCPESVFAFPSSYGGGAPAATWLVRAAVVGTSTSNLSSDKYLPGMGPRRVTTAANGALWQLEHDARSVAKTGLLNDGKYFRRDGSVIAQIFAATSSGSGGINWSNRRLNDTYGSGYGSGGDVLASGSLALSLDSGTYAVHTAELPIVWHADLATYPLTRLILSGTNETGAELYGVIFRNTTYPQGCVVTPLGGSGYQATSFAANHDGCDLLLQAINFDAHWLKVGVNDAYSSVTAVQFKANVLAWIDWVRDKAGDATARIILSSENFRDEGTSEQDGEFDQYAGVLHEIAQADDRVLFLNLRRGLEDAGFSRASSSLTGLTNLNDWSASSVSYAVGDYVTNVPGARNYWRCVTAHTSSGSNKPGTSAGAQYWHPHKQYLGDNVHMSAEGQRLAAVVEIGLIRDVMDAEDAYVTQGAGGNLPESLIVDDDDGPGNAAGGTLDITADNPPLLDPKDVRAGVDRGDGTVGTMRTKKIFPPGFRG